MRLYLDEKKIEYDKKKKQAFLELNFTSFLKCYLLTAFIATGVVWGIIFLLSILFSLG